MPSDSPADGGFCGDPGLVFVVLTAVSCGVNIGKPVHQRSPRVDWHLKSISSSSLGTKRVAPTTDINVRLMSCHS